MSSLRRVKNDGESPSDIRGALGLNLLFEPADPLIDFIFVHGLGGGSRKTWSNTNGLVDFWPNSWLPSDLDFKHVRIHSFGYNSDWSAMKDNVANIHDFGKALLGEIQNSPRIRKENTPIVLIGHSMGGLVIKKVGSVVSIVPTMPDWLSHLPNRPLSSPSKILSTRNLRPGSTVYTSLHVPIAALIVLHILTICCGHPFRTVFESMSQTWSRSPVRFR